MVSFLWLLSCTDPVLTDVIRGIQVVAVEATPAEPSPGELLKLRVWVADGQGQGSDVLVWLCIPLPTPEGKLRCAEVFPQGSDGLPLFVFTRHGRTEGAGSDPWVEFEAGGPFVGWPTLASIAADQYALPCELAGNLFMGVLACAPGVCPIMEQVAIDPQPDSSAWHEAVGMLADLSGRAAAPLLQEQGITLPLPDLDKDRAGWLYDLPRGEVSLAVKRVPVFLPDRCADTGDTGRPPLYGTTTRPTGPNRAPTLVAPVPPGPNDRVVRLRVSDPDRDPVKVRTFVTAGGVWSNRNGDTGLGVLWQEPVDVLRPEELFVVAEDGRGGTAVWHWGDDGCDTPLTAGLGRRNSPLQPGAALPLVPFGTEPPAGPGGRLRVAVPFHVSGPSVPVMGNIELWVGQERVASVEFETGVPQGACHREVGPVDLTLEMPWTRACDLAGNLARLELRLEESGTATALSRESAHTELQVVLVAGQNSGCDQPR